MSASTVPEDHGGAAAMETFAYDDGIVRKFSLATAIWGVVGMLLAAPIAAILKLLLERLELTAPLANLMAGRLGASENGS